MTSVFRNLSRRQRAARVRLQVPGDVTKFPRPEPERAQPKNADDMEAIYQEVTPVERPDQRAALSALDYALALARSGEGAGAAPATVDAAAFRALSASELRSRWDAILIARHADVGLQALFDVGCIAALFPELTKIVDFGDGESHKDVWRHTKQVVIQCIPRLAVRWAALFHDVGKPRTRSVTPDGAVHFFHHAEEGARMFERLDRRLGLFAKDPELGAEISFLILHHQRAHQYEEQWTESDVR